MPEEKKNDWDRGYIQIYTGDGKGKTTAALGLALRSAGAGLRVYIGQFLKGTPTSEQVSLNAFGEQILIEQFGSGRWLGRGKEIDPAEHELAARGLEAIRSAMNGGYGLVIADEILGAIHSGVLQEETVAALIRKKPASVELVLTGRNAPPKLIELADLVTEMRMVKHYYHDGVGARKGIES